MTSLWTILALALITGSYSAAYLPEPSNRVRINLGETPWKFLRSDPGTQAKEVSYSDDSWKIVGIPHCYNDSDTYVNTAAGLSMYHGSTWYRKHFTLDESFRGKKVFIEFQGVNMAAAVYLNGKFMPGNSLVQSPEATHAGGFIGFVVDISDSVNFGTTENILAVRVSNGDDAWYVSPGFGNASQFGMGYGGIYRPVYLHVTDRAYVPLNLYSVVEKWGTYVATVSANSGAATIRVETNVENEYATTQTITLTTTITDADNNVVLTGSEQRDIPGNGHGSFVLSGDIANPHLWYPAWSPYGGPYLYHVYGIVSINGNTVDVFESPLGIRTIAYIGKDLHINGTKHVLPGFGHHNEWPGLGLAASEEQQWRDMSLVTEAGGRFLRPGVVPHSPAAIEACDALGVSIAESTGDNEYNMSAGYLNGTCDTDPVWAYKREFHRDVIIRDRNHPSILLWEAANSQDVACLYQLIAITEQWDSIHPRMNATRGGTGEVMGKTVRGVCDGCDNGVYPNYNAEAWYGQSVRYDWAAQNGHVATYSGDVFNSACQMFGFAHWYLADVPGEGGSATRGAGWSAMDGNRIPKLIYKVYQNALWVPYAQRPGVTLQDHWNYSGTVSVDAWSNCPSVELFLNGASKGVIVPDAVSRRCTWTNVAWEAGVLRAEGRDAGGALVCSDERVASGAPHHIVLSAEPAIVKPNGETFKIRANGSDAAFILATVVDSQGNWCPLSDNPLTFSVSGLAGEYRGSYNVAVTADKSLSYHAPCDPELNAEGGLMKVAIRSTFIPGMVTVTASSPGLVSGSVDYTVQPVDTTASVTILDSVRLSASSLALCLSDTVYLHATGYFHNSRFSFPVNLDGTVNWTSSTPAVVSVDQGRAAALVQGGAVNIIAEYQGQRDTCLVSVPWRTVLHETNGDGGTDRLAIDSDARYVRMVGMRRGTGYGYSLYEFKAYSAGINVALNKNVSVSSVEEGQAGTNAVDGNPGTRWSSSFSDPQTISVDLGGVFHLDSVVLIWEAAYGREYKIQVSEDTALYTNPEVESMADILPCFLTLAPNPFNPSTTIRFGLPAEEARAGVRLAVYGVRGDLIRTLFYGKSAFVATGHAVSWDGLDQKGLPVGSGIYVFRLETRDKVRMVKGLLIK